mmetsp:Transcript_42263/g.111775  ORF Transcript_42263/g.111775 Transcript_42263/m.111775 type:complete len:231 (+) Transcript_42263:318-1010(+)
MSSFFLLSFLSLPYRRMVSDLYSRFQRLKVSSVICWSWSQADFSWALSAEPLFFSPNMANLADFAWISFSIREARLSSRTTSAHIWKTPCRSPESVPADMRFSTDLAPSFCFFMNSASLASASNWDDDSSFSSFCISTSILNAARVFCIRPTEVPAFMRIRKALPFALAALAYSLDLLSTSAILASSSSLLLTACVSFLRAARQSMTILPFAASELRASTFLTLTSCADL